MNKEVLEAIHKEVEAALNDVTDMESLLGQELSQEQIKEKFKMLSEKVHSLEFLLKKEGILE